MQVHVERIPGEPVVEHDLPTDKGFQRQSGEHVQPEAEAGDVDHGVVGGEVVEDVSEGAVAESQEADEGHEETGDHGDAGGDVGDEGEAVDGGGFEGAVD